MSLRDCPRPRRNPARRHRQFTPAQVLAMRDAYRAGAKPRDIAEQMSRELGRRVHYATVNGIVTGETYRDVATIPSHELAAIKARHARRVLTDEQALDYRARFLAGESLADLAAEAGCSRRTLYNLVDGRTYRHLPTTSVAVRRARPQLVRGCPNVCSTVSAPHCEGLNVCS